VRVQAPDFGLQAGVPIKKEVVCLLRALDGGADDISVDHEPVGSWNDGAAGKKKAINDNVKRDRKAFCADDDRAVALLFSVPAFLNLDPRHELCEALTEGSQGLKDCVLSGNEDLKRVFDGFADSEEREGRKEDLHDVGICTNALHVDTRI
jgi:hypothetical protein